jgi:hypothetical protein
MDPIKLLTVATDLRLTNRPECCRVAIGRFYYGAHHVVVQVFGELGWNVSRKSYGHVEARVLLTLSGDTALLDAGKSLGDLYDWRVEADYRLDNPWAEVPGNADIALATANDVVGAAYSMRVEPMKSKIIAVLAQMAVARGMIAMAGRKVRWE